MRAGNHWRWEHRFGNHWLWRVGPILKISVEVALILSHFPIFLKRGVRLKLHFHGSSLPFRCFTILQQGGFGKSCVRNTEITKMRVLGNKHNDPKILPRVHRKFSNQIRLGNKVLRNKFDRTTITADTAECDTHHRDRNSLSLFFQAFSESGVDKFLLKPSCHHAIKSWHVIHQEKCFWFWPQPPDGWVFGRVRKKMRFSKFTWVQNRRYISVIIIWSSMTCCEMTANIKCTSDQKEKSKWW